MSSREDLGKALLECLKEVASLLEHANAVALKQQEALVKNDAEGIVLASKAQEEVLRRIGESDQRAAAVAVKLAEAAGLDAASTDSHAVAQAAGFPYTSLIEHELNKISGIAGRVERENEINATLLKNGLDIIACCLRTLASDTGPTAYSKDASLAEPHAYILSLDRKA
ncbi:MAG: flagellar protein FlgN [Armatimonadetes bacterium]|nr:flagellar protein FlgN [Armatimonadota bacterium]